MDARLYVEDDDAGLRAAQHLDATALAVAKARAAVINQSDKAKALLEAVPESARHDPGYMFSRIQWLRRSDKIAEAAQWMLAAPREPAKAGDADQWWIERRLLARKLLDMGEAKTAYEIANGAAPPVNDNYRAEQHFTAGWIALRFLREPGDCDGAFCPHRRRRIQPDHAGALLLLARPRRRSAGPQPGRSRALSGRGALSDRLLRPTGARPARPRRSHPQRRAGTCLRAPAARNGARL